MKMPFGIPIAISLIILAVLFINIPISPMNEESSTNINPRFLWLGLATTAFVDDNPEFTSPIEVKKDEELSLEPGKYYWKTELLSPTNEFTIDSEVVIETNQEDEIKKIKNVGNIGILLEFFRNFAFTGKAIVDMNESIEISDKNITEIIASQN